MSASSRPLALTTATLLVSGLAPPMPSIWRGSGEPITPRSRRSRSSASAGQVVGDEERPLRRASPHHHAADRGHRLILTAWRRLSTIWRSGGEQPVAQQRSDRGRLLECHHVARVVDDLESRRRDGGSDRLVLGDGAPLVLSPDDHERRHGDRASSAVASGRFNRARICRACCSGLARITMSTRGAMNAASSRRSGWTIGGSQASARAPMPCAATSSSGCRVAGSVGPAWVHSGVEEHECSHPIGGQTPHLEGDSATHRVADDIDRAVRPGPAPRTPSPSGRRVVRSRRS